jgi:FkbM family methyltransferase
MHLLETEAEEITFRRDDIRWTAFPWDVFISWPLFIDGHFRGAELRAVLAWLAARRRFADGRDIIVEVGANIGTSTVLLARETGCRVLAIEPVPENLTVLRRNVIDNGLASQVTCIQAAVTTGGARRIQMIVPVSNSGASEILRPGREPSFATVHRVKRVIDVPVVGLAELLASHAISPDRVAFVWSDAQGCEAEVIASAGSLWEAGVPLYAEIDPGALAVHGGLDALVATAATHFRWFVSDEALIAGGVGAEPRPVDELASACGSLPAERATDVLLLSQAVTAPHRGSR